MTIGSINNPYGPQRVAPSTPTPTKTGGNAAPPAPVAPHGRQDSVSISDSGRALAGSDAARSGGITPERVADLRKKVLEGAYNSAHVVDAVAKRLLSTGDV